MKEVNSMTLQQKMTALMTEVKGEVVERDELIEAIIIALLAKKNLFILGETGQAKSYSINRVRARIEGAAQFERLMSKQTDEEQLFGRLDLPSLIKGEPKLITTGKLPEAHIAFLDEAFKANDGILNALLTALNERRWTNEGETIDIPTISFFAASNEIPNFSNPEERILKPLYDRFDLKLVTEYIEEREARLTMLERKQSRQQEQILHTISLQELYEMQAEVSAVEVPAEINELWDNILCELRTKGIPVSDRKYLGFSPIVQAKAWLGGQAVVQREDLLILRHILWTTPEQRVTINQVLHHACADYLKLQLDVLMKMSLEAVATFEASPDGTLSENLRRLGKLRAELNRIRLMANEFRQTGTSKQQQIDTFNETLEEFNRKASAAAKREYTSLQGVQDILQQQ